MKLQTRLTLISLASVSAIISLNTVTAQASESVKIVAHYEITSIDKAEDHFCQSYQFNETEQNLKHLFLIKTAADTIQPVFCPTNDISNERCMSPPIEEASFTYDERDYRADIFLPAKVTSSTFSTSSYPQVYRFHSEQDSPIAADGYNAEFGTSHGYDVVILEKRTGAIKLELTESIRQSSASTDTYSYNKCQNGTQVNYAGWLKFKATLKLVK